MPHFKINRRQFLKISASALATIPVLGLTQPLFAAKKSSPKAAAPLPAGMTAVLESDPVASAIGYKQNVKDIDYAKYPNRKKPQAKNQFCKNCALFTPVNDSWGKCQMLTTGLVSSQGWCGSWSKKA